MAIEPITQTNQQPDTASATTPTSNPAQPTPAEQQAAQQAGEQAKASFSQALDTERERQDAAETISGKKYSDLTPEEKEKYNSLFNSVQDGSFLGPQFVAASQSPQPGLAGTTVLPTQILGGYTKEGAPGGTALLSTGLDDAARARVAREEFGEAVATRAADMGLSVAGGDVGERLQRVVDGEQVTPETDPWAFIDQTGVNDVFQARLNGKDVTVKGASSAPGVPENPTRTTFENIVSAAAQTASNLGNGILSLGSTALAGGAAVLNGLWNTGKGVGKIAGQVAYYAAVPALAMFQAGAEAAGRPITVEGAGTEANRGWFWQTRIKVDLAHLPSGIGTGLANFAYGMAAGGGWKTSLSSAMGSVVSGGYNAGFPKIAEFNQLAQQDLGRFGPSIYAIARFGGSGLAGTLASYATKQVLNHFFPDGETPPAPSGRRLLTTQLPPLPTGQGLIDMQSMNNISDTLISRVLADPAVAAQVKELVAQPGGAQFFGQYIAGAAMGLYAGDVAANDLENLKARDPARYEQYMNIAQSQEAALVTWQNKIFKDNQALTGFLASRLPDYVAAHPDASVNEFLNSLSDAEVESVNGLLGKIGHDQEMIENYQYTLMANWARVNGLDIPALPDTLPGLSGPEAIPASPPPPENVDPATAPHNGFIDTVVAGIANGAAVGAAAGASVGAVGGAGVGDVVTIPVGAALGAIFGSAVGGVVGTVQAVVETL